MRQNWTFGFIREQIETNEDGVAVVDKPEDALPGTVAIFDEKSGKWDAMNSETDSKKSTLSTSLGETIEKEIPDNVEWIDDAFYIKAALWSIH